MIEVLRFAFFKRKDENGVLGADAFVRALGRNGIFASALLYGAGGARAKAAVSDAASPG